MQTRHPAPYRTRKTVWRLPLAVFLGLAVLSLGCEGGPRPVGSDSEAQTASQSGEDDGSDDGSSDSDRPSGDRTPMFDFSDEYYRQNGLDPEAIPKRVGNPDRDPLHWTVDQATDPTRRDIRILQHTGGWDASGHLIYYTVQGMVMPGTFTDDEAGRRAREIAEEFRAFIFPKTQPDGSVVLSPAPPNRRQDNVFDTSGGYFSNNPLGLWVLSFVVYTDKALHTEEGQEELAKIAEDNGRDLEGTPILQTVSEIENLHQDGLVEILERPKDGSQGAPWVI